MTKQIITIILAKNGKNTTSSGYSYVYGIMTDTKVKICDKNVFGKLRPWLFVGSVGPFK